MLWFVLVYLTIYTLMHVLVLRGIRPLLPTGSARSRAVIVWMACMVLAPMVTRMLERAEFEVLARGVAWVGYCWMGVVFLAFSAFAFLACGEVLLRLTAKIFPAIPLLELCNRRSAQLVLLVTLVAAGYGLYEARDLRVESVTLQSSKLAAGTAPLRIAQISDLHLGMINRETVLRPVIDQLQALQPDLLVVTGDLVDARINHLGGLSAMWREINPPLGKFAIIGNHEVYAELEQSRDFIERSGFTLLRQQAVAAGDRLTVVGVDDPALRRPVDEGSILTGLPTGRFTVLLKHRPWIGPDSHGLFDLQLSGHAHRGQIFPFNLLTGLAYPLQDGLTRLSWGGHLYASRGTGTWGPPLRILSPPEITLFEIAPLGAVH